MEEREKEKYQNRIEELEKKKMRIESRQRMFAKEILDYITGSAKNQCKYAVYLDADGEEKPLRCFFE